MNEKFKKHLEVYGHLYILGVFATGMLGVSVAIQKNYKSHLESHLNLAVCAHDTLFHEVLPEALKNLNSPSIT